MSLRTILVAFLVLCIGGAVLTNRAFRQRQILRKVAERVDSVDRYVDIGVVLKVVVADPKGDVVLDGKPRLRVIREHRFGGIIDTKSTPPTIAGPSRAPRTWYCSVDQETALVHNDPNCPAQLIQGSEGAGKTTVLAMWHYVGWTRSIGEYREFGQTAPTEQRLEFVREAMFQLFAPSWFRYQVANQRFVMCDGTRIQLVSTAPRPKSQGSPIQGFNWSRCGRDELQDQLHVHEDIESRGRSAKDGIFEQLATATAKDDPEYRTLRDQLIGSGAWSRRDLSIFRSPFIDPAFIEAKRKSVSPREFLRRYGDPVTGMIRDLAPEAQLYYSWSRAENLRPVPHLGARKITSIVLSRKTGNRNHSLLVGHDPGTAKAGSVFLDAYELPGEPDPVWWVRGELFTMHKSTEEHALEVLAMCRKFGCNVSPTVPEIAHVRAQPVGQSESKPDLDVYRVFARVGLHIKAAQYRKDGTGTGQIKKDSRIEMVNRLLCDARGRRRLFIDTDPQGRPVAPKLVEAFEKMERDHLGRAEHEEKDEHDLSDVPAALGYALWPWEKEAATALRQDIRAQVLG